MPTVAVTTQPTFNVGPNTGFKARGTIQGQDGEFKDDLLVQGDLEVVGTFYGAALQTTGDITLAARKDITMDAAADGTFTSGTGDVTLNGDVILADGKDLTMHADGTGTFTTGVGDISLNGDVTVATGKDILMVEAGTGTFYTGAGAVHLNGETTVASNKGLAVTTADKLTVGGVIVPQELVIMAPYKAAEVDHTIFIASRTYTVVAVKHMSEIADTAVGAATVGVMKCTAVEAASAGKLVTTATCDLKTVTQVVTSMTPTATAADLILVSGERLALDFTGNTDGTGIIMVTLKRT